MPAPSKKTSIAMGEIGRGHREQHGASLLRRGSRPVAMTQAADVLARSATEVYATSSWMVAIVERAQAGDRVAFELLVERELESAYRIARAILGNDADALDATQEAFVHGWRELPRLREPDRFDAWLRAIVVNSCRQALRGRRRRLVREIAMGEPGDGASATTVGEAAFDQRVADADALERAFERLPVDERAILVLHHLERQPLTEVAATLAVPIGTAKSRLFAARRDLERALEVELR